MARRKKQAPLRLDATGRCLVEQPLRIGELLRMGTPSDVRGVLGEMGALLCWGRQLTPEESEWLGTGLLEIALGRNANAALRVQRPRANAQWKSVREWVELRHQVADIKAQGGSAQEAYRLIAADRLTHDRKGEPTEEQVLAEADKIKTALRSRKNWAAAFSLRRGPPQK